MSLINRIKVLWYLSGLEFDKTVDETTDLLLSKEIEREAKFHRETLRKKQPATILQDDPLDFFPNEEDNDKTNKPTSTD